MVTLNFYSRAIEDGKQKVEKPNTKGFEQPEKREVQRLGKIEKKCFLLATPNFEQLFIVRPNLSRGRPNANLKELSSLAGN